MREMATYDQRRELYDLYEALDWPKRGIHSMTREEASAALIKARGAIKPEEPDGPWEGEDDYD